MEAADKSCLILLIVAEMCEYLIFPAVGFWCNTEITFENAGQVTLIGEAALKCNVGQRCIRPSEQVLRFLDPLTHHELMGAFACRLSK